MATALALTMLDNERNYIPRNYLRNRIEAFDYPDATFVKLFRLDKEAVMHVCNKINCHLTSSRIPVHLKVLVALRFFATGSYQMPVANDVNILLSQPSVSKCIRDVSKATSCHLLAEYIKFPRIEEIPSIKEKFYSKSGFPGVIGAIDCTHVAIVTPPSTENGNMEYINRKGFVSINVQLIVGPDLRIYGIIAKYPGSVHDSFIWRDSLARGHISRIGNGWLVGDSGYPLEPYLMTPFPNAEADSIEEFYNYKHSLARVCVERCNGVLKTRFRCLLKDRTLHYCPTTSAHIINACAVLHNICNIRKITLNEGDSACQVEDFPFIDPPVADVDNSRAKNIRLRLALSMVA